jgi:hypothetical protein
MYSKPDYTTFNVDGMDILISVYSPRVNSLQKVSPRNEDDDDGQKTFWVKLMQQKNTVYSFICLH